MLLLTLLESKVVLGQEVVVDVHLIVHILIRSDACQGEFVEVVADAQAVTHRHTGIGRRLVVADLTHKLLTVLFGLCRADIFVGVTTLLHNREGERIVDAQCAITVLELGAEVAAILLVAERVIVEVAPISVVAGILRRERKTELLAKLVVGGCSHSQRIARAIVGTEAHTLIGQGRERVVIYHAGHRIATIERSLRTAQELYALDILQLGVVEIFVGQLHIIDSHSHNGLVDSGTHTTNIYRGGGTRAIVGYKEVWDVGQHILDSRHTTHSKGATCQNRCRNSLAA